MYVLALLILNGLVTYAVVRVGVRALLDEERERWLSELREACRASGGAGPLPGDRPKLR